MAPASDYGTSVSMMISYGGEIVQGGKAAAAYYAGGVHRIVKVGMSERLPDLRARLAALAGCSDVFIRYALPGEGLSNLRDVADDGDLWSLVSLLFYYKDVSVSKPGRIRVFLFAVDAPPLRSASAPSLQALAEEGDTAAASGSSSVTPVTLDLPRSASSPLLAASGGARDGTAVRMKVSYGGEIIQGDGSAASSYYAGGIHRIVRVGLSERLTGLRARLAALAGCSDVRIRYALPEEEEGLGHLRDVASDGDLWSLVSLLFFHEAVMTRSSNPKQGRIRVFLFGADAPATSPPAAPLRRSASSPFLPTLVEEDEDDDDDTDTAAATQTAGGGGSSPSRVTVTVGMRRSASSPALALALATSSSGSDAATWTSGGATAASSGDSDTPAMTSSSAAPAAVQFGPVVLVPVMPAMVGFPVIPVYAIRVVDYRGVLLVAQ